MSAVIHDVEINERTGKKRNKACKALRTLRRAIARRKLEQMRDDELLRAQLYDVFEDSGETG